MVLAKGEHPLEPRARQRGKGEPMSVSSQVATGTEGTQTAGRRKPVLSEGARAERRLGWLLCAPAVIVMIAVTAYPVGYAIYLSLERYNLELPNAIKFVGLSNYAAVLGSHFWWQALAVTAIITAISVAFTLVLGMLLAMLMHRTLFGRGTVRTAALIPYGIVTVAAAYGWQYAWTPGQGYFSALFNYKAPLTHQVTAVAVIILAEIWKTTPFMALLLLAGLSQQRHERGGLPDLGQDDDRHRRDLMGQRGLVVEQRGEVALARGPRVLPAVGGGDRHDPVRDQRRGAYRAPAEQGPVHEHGKQHAEH